MPKGVPKEPVIVPCKRCGVMIQKKCGSQKYCRNCAQVVDAAQRRRRRDEYNARIKAAKAIKNLAKPTYSVAQVTKRADALGISYGKCSQLLSEGKITMEEGYDP